MSFDLDSIAARTVAARMTLMGPCPGPDMPRDMRRLWKLALRMQRRALRRAAFDGDLEALKVLEVLYPADFQIPSCDVLALRFYPHPSPLPDGVYADFHYNTLAGWRQVGNGLPDWFLTLYRTGLLYDRHGALTAAFLARQTALDAACFDLKLPLPTITIPPLFPDEDPVNVPANATPDAARLSSPHP